MIKFEFQGESTQTTSQTTTPTSADRSVTSVDNDNLTAEGDSGELNLEWIHDDDDTAGINVEVAFYFCSSSVHVCIYMPGKHFQVCLLKR